MNILSKSLLGIVFMIHLHYYFILSQAEKKLFVYLLLNSTSYFFLSIK